MPQMSDTLSVPANTLSANVLAGQLYEFATRASKVTVLATASATGVRVTFNTGGDQIVDDQLISAANRFPVVPDDIVVSDGVRPGERLVLRFRNTTAGALIVFWTIQLVQV